MAGDPKDAKANQLRNAHAAAGAAGGAAGAGAAPCEWELKVKVHSQERFWPKAPFDVKVHQLDAAGDLGAVDFSKTVQMTAKTSPPSEFCGAGRKEYGVTATVKSIAAEKEWILAASKNSKAPLAKDYKKVKLRPGDKGARAKKVDLFVRHPLEVHFQLKFKDPANRDLFFPENFPVQIFSKSGKVLEVKTGPKGVLDFEMDRKFDFFTLKFGGSKILISNGDGSTNACELKAWKDKKDLAAAKAKFFSPPTRWALIESDWAFSAQPKFIDNLPAYKPAEGKIYIFDPPTKDWVRRIGEKAAPVVLTLDPHWQFTRFELFDRYYGHTDHGHKRVNSPTVFVEGFWSPTGKNREREGGGFWTLNEATPATSVHCLPWIRQKDNKGNEKKRPDKHALLMFETAPGTFVSSVDKNTRQLAVLDPKKNKAQLLPSADRLKLYDLPKVWKSANYFARFKDGAGKTPGKFFEEWADADHLKSRSSATPMIFSLDDVVLANSSGNTLKFAAADLFAVFYHRFKPAYDEAGNVSHAGVYNPGTPEPLDSGTLKGKDFNYIVDYPNWVRLVAGRSALFDVFDKRTKGAVIGARAGIRHYNPAASGAGPGAGVPAAGTIKKDYTVLTPYFQMAYPHFRRQFLPEPKCPTTKDGRFDMAILRCCDRAGNKELFVNLSYFRFLYKYLAPSAAHTGSAMAGGGPAQLAAQKAYEKNAATNVMKRWNGADAASTKRAELIPQDGVSKLTGEAIYFIQAVKANKEAHFRMDVDNLAAKNERAFMNSADGEGSIDDLDFQPTGGFGDPLDFTFAHEFGHGASLPDEYGEWWNNCSDNGPGILCNTPGDPFVDEGTDIDFISDAVNHKKVASGWAMMNMSVQMRNRYFWHNAEFARKFTGTSFSVQLGALNKYNVPGHPSFPKRIYTYWPVKAKVSATRGAHGKFDVYLHATGQDAFTVTILPNIWKTVGPIDGILSVLHRIRIQFPTGIAVAPGQVRNVIRNAMIALTGQFHATGTAQVKTDAGMQNLPLTKALIRFSPRFLIHPSNFVKDPNTGKAPTAAAKADYQNNFNSLQNKVGTQYKVKVHKAGVGVPAPGFNKGKYALDLVLDLTKPLPVAAALLTAQAKQFYTEMLGVAFNPLAPNVKKEDLVDIAAMVIKTGPGVGNLP